MSPGKYTEPTRGPSDGEYSQGELTPLEDLNKQFTELMKPDSKKGISFLAHLELIIKDLNLDYERLDLAIEGYIRAHNYVKRTNNYIRFLPTFLRKTIRSMVIDEWRKRPNQIRQEFNENLGLDFSKESSPIDLIAEQYDSAITRQELWKACRHINYQDRHMLFLKYLKGWDYSRIADWANNTKRWRNRKGEIFTEQTLRRRLKRARDKVADLLEDSSLISSLHNCQIKKSIEE